MSDSSSTATFAGVGTASLASNLDDAGADDSYTIHGVALGANDITYGKNKKKFWPAEELEKAAESLAGRPLVKDHENTTDGRVGTVTKAMYQEGVGVIYEAEIAPHYEEHAKDVQSGLLEVSVRALHPKSEQLTTHEESGAVRVENLVFDNLSLVNQGASPSNTANFGDMPSNPVSSAYGIASTSEGTPETVATATLSAGSPRPEPDEIQTELESDGADPSYSVDDYVQWDSQNGNEIGQIEGVYTMGDDLPEIRGDNSFDIEEGEVFYAINVHKEDDEGTLHPTSNKPVGHYEDTLQKVDAPSSVSDEALDLDELSIHEAPVYEEGDLVRWQVRGDLFGMITHVPEEEAYVMVDVHELEDGELVTTNFTVSAGYSDIYKTDRDDLMEALAESEPEEDAESEEMDDDVESNDEESEELASMDELDSVYDEWDSHVNMTASELEEWENHPCADKASVDPDAVISRNLELLKTNKSDWTTDHIEDAKRTSSFISRMSAEENKPEAPRDGPSGCPSEWAISLLNWAYNPFDSIPDKPESDEESESVDADLDDDVETEAAELVEVMHLRFESVEDGDVYEESVPEEQFKSHYVAPGNDKSGSKMAVVDADGILRREAVVQSWENRGRVNYDSTIVTPAGAERVLIRAAGHFDTVPFDPYTATHINDIDGYVEEREDAVTREAEEDIESSTENGETDSTPDSAESVASEAVDGETQPEVASLTVATTDSHTTMNTITYEELSEETVESELSDPVVVEESELEALQDEAEQAESVEEELSSLRSEFGELSEAREIVESFDEEELSLIEGDAETEVVESTELAETREAIEDVSTVYAEELSEHSPWDAEELSDKFGPLEMKAKIEEHDEAELSASISETDPEPEAETVESEELSETQSEAEEEELREQLREEYATELTEAGWDSQAEKVRSGEIELEELGVDVEDYAE